MDFFLFKSRVYGYLSYLKIEESEEVNVLISNCLDRLTENDLFSYRFAEYKESLDFMKKEPYTSFLSGSDGYYLVASTLGDKVDEIIKPLKDKSKLIFDACANAYLEMKNEELRESLGDDLSYMFCPGYQGSDAAELKYILAEIKAYELGINLLPSGMMLPQKSMAGIYAKGVSPQKKCGNCVKINDCAYRKAGKLCFHLENK
ncbi:MAG: hypothetical protein J6Q67_03115 [Clostridia bacterium]|nr:hypothetical protein [Clostridia bacterium]